MKKLSIVIIYIALICSLCLQTSCAGKMEKAEAVEDTTAIVEDPLAEIRAQRAEKFKDEEDKVIGDVKFFVSEKDWNKNSDKYFKSLQNKDKSISAPFYMVGNYGFFTKYPSFHNDSLYSVQLRGNIHSYEYYDYEVPKAFKAALELYSQKYGKPDVIRELPAFHNTPNNSYVTLASWQVGPKKITIELNCGSSDYSVDVCITRTDILEIVKKEKAAQQASRTAADADVI